uniref:Trehalose 6-phosphate phosphatase n=1 Tax=Thermosporothrix sp. COM3 TaxID=2490863 RepID=A0A455SRF8_9CHLR|nr:trehalose-phosphatase [Thermosporothrix sp. COM3]
MKTESDVMTTTALQSVLKQKPLGLVFDIDGTLSPIAPTPAEARLFPGIDTRLRELSRYAKIAILTGRAAKEGAAMVNVEGLTYFGTHGLEWCNGLPSPTNLVEIVPEAKAYIEPGNRIMDLAERELANEPGILIERKQLGGTIHYRLAPDKDHARQRILDVVEGPVEQAHMRLGYGKFIIEVLSPLKVNKGVALRSFAQKMDLRGVIFAGDDRTDLDAMEAVSELRQEGISGLSIAVQHHDTLPALLNQADLVVQGVEGMAATLQGILEYLKQLNGSL